MPRVLTFLCFLFMHLALHAQPKKITAIKAGRLIDTDAGRVLENQVIIIVNDTITAVGPGLSIPKDAVLIDLGKATVIPGLIDCHTHITFQPDGDYYANMFRESVIDNAVKVHIYAKRTLDAGFTTIRDVGSQAFLDVSTRNAINKGSFPGPRMLCATTFIGSTGSHGDLNGFSPFLDSKFPPEMSGVADGVDELRKLVRYNIKYGADLIKFGAGAGVLSEEESVGNPQFTQEEMNAIVSEAKMWGRKTCAHAHGTEAIKMAIKAGVVSVEHGSFIDDEGIELMKKNGTYLVADIYNDDYIMSEYKKLGYPDKILEKERLVGKTQRENFAKAVKAGVKIAFGTDAGVYPHGWNAKQFFYMVKFGLTPMQAIQSATSNAADLLGWSDKVGSIAVGKLADIVAVNGDPLQNITVLENIFFVMKAGEVVKESKK